MLEAAARGLEPVVVNPVETYASGDDEWVTAGNVRDILAGWPALAVRGGTAVAHADDVADGICSALKRGRAGERYILGGDNLTIEQIVRTVLDLAGLRRPVVTLPAAPVRAALRAIAAVGLRPPMEPEVIDYARLYWFMSSAKAAAELGYPPRPARAALADVVAWVRAPGERAT